MRWRTFLLVSGMLLGFSTPGPRAGAVYLNPDDASGDYVFGPNAFYDTFDASTRTLDARSGDARIVPDVRSIQGLYNSSLSSYVFTIKFWNDTIALPKTAYSGVDTRVAGYLDISIPGASTSPSALSLADQQYMQFMSTPANPNPGPYGPMHLSQYYLDLGTVTSDGTTTNAFLRETSSHAPSDPASLGIVALADSQTMTITVPIAALGLTQQANSLQYSFVALSYLGETADFAPSSGGPYVVGVPETASLTLLGLGCVGLVLGSWRYRRRPV